MAIVRNLLTQAKEFLSSNNFAPDSAPYDQQVEVLRKENSQDQSRLKALKEVEEQVIACHSLMKNVHLSVESLPSNQEQKIKAALDELSALALALRYESEEDGLAKLEELVADVEQHAGETASTLEILETELKSLEDKANAYEEDMKRRQVNLLSIMQARHEVSKLGSPMKSPAGKKIL